MPYRYRKKSGPGFLKASSAVENKDAHVVALGLSGMWDIHMQVQPFRKDEYVKLDCAMISQMQLFGWFDVVHMFGSLGLQVHKKRN